MRMMREKLFMHVPADMPINQDMPVFSEAYLYGRVGKENARFILGIAEEYEHLILLLGENKVKELLGTSLPKHRYHAICNQIKTCRYIRFNLCRHSEVHVYDKNCDIKCANNISENKCICCNQE